MTRSLTGLLLLRLCHWVLVLELALCYLCFRLLPNAIRCFRLPALQCRVCRVHTAALAPYWLHVCESLLASWAVRFPLVLLSWLGAAYVWISWLEALGSPLLLLSTGLLLQLEQSLLFLFHWLLQTAAVLARARQLLHISEHSKPTWVRNQTRYNFMCHILSACP